MYLRVGDGFYLYYMFVLMYLATRVLVLDKGTLWNTRSKLDILNLLIEP